MEPSLPTRSTEMFGTSLVTLVEQLVAASSSPERLKSSFSAASVVSLVDVHEAIDDIVECYGLSS